MYDIIRFCGICGHEVMCGEGEKFVLNERPNIYLCSQCSELFWLWELRKDRPIYNDTQYNLCYEMQQKFYAVKGW